MTQPTSSAEQAFLDDLDKRLWNAADRLRSNLDAAVYKHAVLGLIFLKYVSDAFDLRREELEAAFRDPKSDYFLDRADFKTDAAYAKAIQDELEDRDYFTEKNVFWVPPLARWKTIRENAALAPDTEIAIRNGKVEKYTFRSAARLIDDALEAVEKENPRLKGVIEKNRYMQLQIEPAKLVGLISEVVSSIPFRLPSTAGRGAGGESPCCLTRWPRLPSTAGRGAGGEGSASSLNAKDILGHVYEYFLGQFALAEGKKGGQYYTPKSIVSVIVEMLEPYSGKVYDPAMGSGGFFVQSEAFIEAHGGKLGAISVYGQESNPTTWRLAAMNMAIRGIDFNFGKQPADTFLSDQHPDLRADYVMANPPFNISEWWDGRLEGDPRWVYGTPPKSNANFAWVQHMLHHLAPHGSMALLLANGSMSSNTKGEGEIRKALVEADLVECILALPGQLFTNTQIPACVWFLTKSKAARGPSPRAPLPKGEGKGESHFRGGFDYSGLVKVARELRIKQTPAEEGFWQVVRNRQFMNLKFRRQHQIGDYIVDFYCHESKLVVELDGEVHSTSERQKTDHKRDAYLRSMGLTVLRFKNDTWLNVPEAVLEQIRSHASDSSPTGRGQVRETGLRDRRGEVLFLDARQLGYMKDRVLRDFSAADLEKISGTYRAWKRGPHPASGHPLPVGEGRGQGESMRYQDIAGFCKSATLAEIASHGFVLTPGRYVGAEDIADDGEPFDEKMQKLVIELNAQFAESAKLEQAITRNLKGLGYGD